MSGPAQLAGISQANLSQHLALLRQRRIVNTRMEGLNIYYSIANSKIIEACVLLREVLLEQLAENVRLIPKTHRSSVAYGSEDCSVPDRTRLLKSLKAR